MLKIDFILWLGGLLLLCSSAEKRSLRTNSSTSEGCVQQRVLITGISGMIGSHVARALLRQRGCYKVCGIVRPRSDLSPLAGVLNQVELILGDITDSVRMIEIFKQVSPALVFHFAAQAINGISFHMAQLSLNTNIMGTLNVLEAIRHVDSHKPRVLIAGSSTEYGTTAETHDGPVSENVILAPISPYGISKLATERLAHLYFVTYGQQIVTARLFIHVGVGGTDSLAIHEFCKQISMAELGLASNEIVHGNLESYRDMTDAADSANTLIELALKGKPGDAYNVGSGTCIQTKQLLEIAMSFSTLKNLTARSDKSRLRVFDEMRLVANIDKLQKLTGWKPQPNMNHTVKRILDFWRTKVRELYCAETLDGGSPCSAVSLVQ